MAAKICSPDSLFGVRVFFVVGQFYFAIQKAGENMQSDREDEFLQQKDMHV